MAKKILIAVSSTGGHIYPGLAVAKQLQKEGYEILFIGKKNNIISNEGYKFYPISAIGLQRKASLKIFNFIIKFIYSVFQSLKILANEKPAIVIGFGGYISFPVILAAWLKNVPSIIHEQNYIPGLANRISVRFVNKICVSFRESEEIFSSDKVILTGNPVREAILSIKKEPSNYAHLPLTCLVFGGSQGSHNINTAIINSVDKLSALKEKINFIHITGEKDYEIVKNAYLKNGIKSEVYNYLFKIEEAYKKTSFTICRSGAMTISELISLRMPAILIPYPYSTENHQKANAEYLSKNDCSILIEETDIDNLLENIIKITNHPEILSKMSESYQKIPIINSLHVFSKIVKEMGSHLFIDK